MAFGDSPHDESMRNAWRRFCEQLQAAGDLVFKDHNPATPSLRADAFRFLTQNLGQAFDLALETKDTKYPILHPFCHPRRKLGGDAADFLYLQAWIDGESVYKISGNRGTTRFLNFTVQGPRPERQPGTDIPSLHEPFGDIPEANLFGHQLVTASDGSFELFLGGQRREGNWLPTTPGSRKLFVRQGFDRWDEVPARLSIERVDMAEPQPLPTPDDLIRAMDWAGSFVVALMNDWPDHPYRHSAAVDAVHVNTFPAAPALLRPTEVPRGRPRHSDSCPSADSAADASDRKRGRAVAHMCWELAADEALIVEFDSHAGFWMVSNNGVFFNSMDYLYRPVSYTPSRTKVDADGKVRLILSHEDPGYHNWLDTQGFVRGNLTYRNLLSDAATTFHSRLVKCAELMDTLPNDSVRVTAAERVAQLQTRFAAIRRRYGW